MRVLLASDKFKGSLTAAEVAAALSTGLRQADPSLEIACVPVADGGDGTLDAAIAAGFEPVAVAAAGPTGKLHRASYGRHGDTAVVELASICGLALLAGDVDPMGASSYGLGTALGAAVDAGIRRVVIGIGGSASTDGGAGMLQALGARILDSRGAPLGRGGAALADVATVDLADLPSRLSGVALVVASDVDNPLCGPDGAAAVYGRQKGASPQQVERLDAGLARLATAVTRATGVDRSHEPGAGAAGGVGFATLVLGAQMRSGAVLVLELVGFAAALDHTDLVITGEGSLDAQTLAGKAPAGVAAAARAHGKRVIAVAGRSTLPQDVLERAGIERVYALTDLQPDPARCMADAAALLRRTGTRIAVDLLAERPGR